MQVAAPGSQQSLWKKSCVGRFLKGFGVILHTSFGLQVWSMMYNTAFGDCDLKHSVRGSPNLHSWSSTGLLLRNFRFKLPQYPWGSKYISNTYFGA